MIAIVVLGALVAVLGALYVHERKRSDAAEARALEATYALWKLRRQEQARDTADVLYVARRRPAPSIERWN